MKKTRGKKRGRTSKEMFRGHERKEERRIGEDWGSDWEEERRRFFEDRGLKLEELESRKREWCTELMRAGKEIDRKERWRRIIDSTYNKWCKTIKGDGILGYLKKGAEQMVKDG